MKPDTVHDTLNRVTGGAIHNNHASTSREESKHGVINELEGCADHSNMHLSKIKHRVGELVPGHRLPLYWVDTPNNDTALNLEKQNKLSMHILIYFLRRIKLKDFFSKKLYKWLHS